VTMGCDASSFSAFRNELSRLYAGECYRGERRRAASEGQEEPHGTEVSSEKWSEKDEVQECWGDAGGGGGKGGSKAGLKFHRATRDVSPDLEVDAEHVRPYLRRCGFSEAQVRPPVWFVYVYCATSASARCYCVYCVYCVYCATKARWN
jgi:hypothetical protein